MTMPLTEREVQSIFDQLEKLNEKVDQIHILAQKAEAVDKLDEKVDQIHQLAQETAAHNAWAKGEVVRLDRQHRDMHGEVFGDKGLSNRVQRTEHALARHAVVIGIITAVGLAVLVAVANRELGVKGREAAAAIAR